MLRDELSAVGLIEPEPDAGHRPGPRAELIGVAVAGKLAQPVIVLAVRRLDLRQAPQNSRLAGLILAHEHRQVTAGNPAGVLNPLVVLDTERLSRSIDGLH
jgi:hypothetical protein